MGRLAKTIAVFMLVSVGIITFSLIAFGTHTSVEDYIPKPDCTIPSTAPSCVVNVDDFFLVMMFFGGFYLIWDSWREDEKLELQRIAQSSQES